jgi:hypothetical protein
MAEQRKQFKSVLDYRPQFENIIDALVPDIEFSYSAIMNNATIQTYFNMLSMEYYGYEYYQLIRLNDLKFKINERTLNLTILEIVYNIVKEIVKRKWRYSEYIAYDMYILPLRIKKYVNAMNYRFINTETPDKKEIKKLVSAGTRAVSEELVDTYHDDRINNIVISYRSCGSDEIQSKLNLFKNLSPFLTEAKSIVFQRFGTEFGDKFFKDLGEMDTYKSDQLTEKQTLFVKKHINNMFDIGMIIILIMSDAMKAGVWDRIKAAEKRRLEAEDAKKTIEEANRRLKAIKVQEDKETVSATIELKKGIVKKQLPTKQLPAKKPVKANKKVAKKAK